jgi:hypothetical protein
MVSTPTLMILVIIKYTLCVTLRDIRVITHFSFARFAREAPGASTEAILNLNMGCTQYN